MAVLPSFFWWGAYMTCAVWAQELSGGHDFLSPGVLVCLQFRRLWQALSVAVLWIFLHEGAGSLAFGTSLLFYAGLFVLFFVSQWLLEPENPLFILTFSLGLAGWLYVVLAGAISFQEIATRLPDPWPWVFRQWSSYVLTWAISLFVYRKVMPHGRV